MRSAFVAVMLASAVVDRQYWSFLRFEPGKLIYRNGTSEFTAPRSK